MWHHRGSRGICSCASTVSVQTRSRCHKTLAFLILFVLVRHLIVDCQPVRCDLDLGPLQRDSPRAYLRVQIILYFVLLMKTRFRASQFRPEVCYIIRAAKLQAHQMVNLVLTGAMMGDTVRSVYLVLLACRHVAHRTRIAGLTYLRFCSGWNDSTRRTGRVGKSIMCLAV